MSEALLVRHCSPTLAGLKTASMFSCPYASEAEMRDELRKLNRVLTEKGLCVIPLRYHNGKGLIYVYRPQQLKADLLDGSVCSMLKDRGYPCGDPVRCLNCLVRRVQDSKEVPHEIGFFLGYPPEDVAGFIEKKTPTACSGPWKVYGDANAAQQRFDRYKACTCAYCEALAQGKQLEHLIVPS